MKKIILRIFLGLVVIFVIYSIVNISYYTAKRNAEREAKRASQQTAYVIDSLQKTNLALTPTANPETDLAKACQKGDGTPVEITSTILPSIIVQTRPNFKSDRRDYFAPNSFFIKQADTKAGLNALSVCSKSFFTNCVYMFWIPQGESTFDPEDLKGYDINGKRFNYQDVVIIVGTIELSKSDSSTEGCMINVESIQGVE